METKSEKKMTVATSVALIVNDIGYIKHSMEEIKDALKNEYVTKSEFSPVKLIAFGFVGIIITAVLGSLIALVVR